jgi:regulator of protease activity HflC (stomatin/prohibitin superfamily)
MKSYFLGLYKSVIIQDHEAALLFSNGQFLRELKPGKHTFTFDRTELTVETFDLRARSLLVQGQELLSADQVALKVSAVAAYRVADALKLRRTSEYPEMLLHTDMQLALRQMVAQQSAEEFLAKKSGFASELKALLADRFTAVGLQLEHADIRDVMLPADLKRAFTDALKSKQEANASLEKARAETAALRTLANAAKLMRDNPELLSLRYLQTLKDVGSTGDKTLVLGLTESAKLAVQPQ